MGPNNKVREYIFLNLSSKSIQICIQFTQLFCVTNDYAVLTPG